MLSFVGTEAGPRRPRAPQPGPRDPPLPGAVHTCGVWSLMGSAPEGLRLHARKSSPRALKLAEIRRFYECWAKFFAPSGPAPVLEATRRTSGWWRWGFCSIRSWLAAYLRRVAALMMQFPPFGGSAAAVCSGGAPKPQTTSVKNAENGLPVAKWSAFWANRHPRGVLVAREPAIVSGNPPCRT